MICCDSFIICTVLPSSIQIINVMPTTIENFYIFIILESASNFALQNYMQIRDRSLCSQGLVPKRNWQQQLFVWEIYKRFRAKQKAVDIVQHSHTQSLQLCFALCSCTVFRYMLISKFLCLSHLYFLSLMAHLLRSGAN